MEFKPSGPCFATHNGNSHNSPQFPLALGRVCPSSWGNKSATSGHFNLQAVAAREQSKGKSLQSQKDAAGCTQDAVHQPHITGERSSTFPKEPTAELPWGPASAHSGDCHGGTTKQTAATTRKLWIYDCQRCPALPQTELTTSWDVRRERITTQQPAAL